MGTTKLAIVKPELYRFSYDISHPNLAHAPFVLRIWSGASDMSIDVSGEKKESINETPNAAKIEVHKDEDQPRLSKIKTNSGIKPKYFVFLTNQGPYGKIYRDHDQQHH